jgi:lipopolysaccharide export system protein LptC
LLVALIPQRFQLLEVSRLTSFLNVEEPPATLGRRSRSQTAQSFRAAARHSARVRFLRFALPIGIVVIVGVILGLTFFNPFRILARLPLDPGKIVISGTKVTMAGPKLAGFTRDARAYDLTARSATQDLTKPDVLELQDISAKVDMQDKARVELTAATGVYDRKAEQLTLLDNILLTSSSGYEARLTQAMVDIKTGIVVSHNPVEVKMLHGTINANRLEVGDKGDVVRFDGGVSMILILGNSSNGPAAQQ